MKPQPLCVDSVKALIASITKSDSELPGPMRRKRELKDEEKSYTAQQLVKFRIDIQVPKVPLAIQAAIESTVSLDQDTSWLVESPVDFLLVSMNSVLLHDEVLFSVFIHLSQPVSRWKLWRCLKLFKQDTLAYFSFKQTEAMVTASTDLRITGHSLDHFISWAVTQQGSPDSIVFSYMGAEDLIGCAPYLDEEKDDPKLWSLRSKLCNSQKQAQSQKRKPSSQKVFDFHGTSEVKALALTNFQYLCWAHVAEIMQSSQFKSQNTKNKAKLRDWRRHQSTDVLVRMLSMASLVSLQLVMRRNYSLLMKSGQAPSSASAGTLPALLTHSNMMLVIDTWQEDFRMALRDHVHTVDEDVVHPHPIVSYQYRFDPQQLKIKEFDQCMKVFNPWFHGVEYALPCLLFVVQAATQIFRDDVSRRNCNGATILLGEPGSGKSKLLNSIQQKFSGYQWQKKGNNFQSRVLEIKSLVTVDEFDSHSLKLEQIQNEWKQRFDQEQSAYCDRKGVQGSNCTKFVPFFASTNESYSWFLKNYPSALLRRLFFVRFPRSLKQFSESVDVKLIPSRTIDMSVSPSIVEEQIANLVLLLGFFRPHAQGEHSYYTETVLKHVFELLLYNRNQVLVRVLMNEGDRAELFSLIDQYNQQQTIKSVDLESFYRKLYEEGSCGQRLLSLMMRITIGSDSQYESTIGTLRQLPFKDCGQYRGRAYLAKESEQLTLRQFNMMILSLEDNRLTRTLKARLPTYYAMNKLDVAYSKVGGVSETDSCDECHSNAEEEPEANVEEELDACSKSQNIDLDCYSEMSDLLRTCPIEDMTPSQYQKLFK